MTKLDNYITHLGLPSGFWHL